MGGRRNGLGSENYGNGVGMHWETSGDCLHILWTKSACQQQTAIDSVEITAMVVLQHLAVDFVVVIEVDVASHGMLRTKQVFIEQFLAQCLDLLMIDLPGHARLCQSYAEMLSIVQWFGQQGTHHRQQLRKELVQTTKGHHAVCQVGCGFECGTVIIQLLLDLFCRKRTGSVSQALEGETGLQGLGLQPLSASKHKVDPHQLCVGYGKEIGGASVRQVLTNGAMGYL